MLDLVYYNSEFSPEPECGCFVGCTVLETAFCGHFGSKIKACTVSTGFCGKR